MSYREKIAWLSLLSVVLTLGPYLVYVAVTRPGPDVPNLGLLLVFGIAAGANGIIRAAGEVVMRWRNPVDARIPMDEREILIERRSITVAYYILMFGFLVVGGVMPFKNYGWDIVNTAIAAIVVAECVQYGLVIIGHRRHVT